MEMRICRPLQHCGGAMILINHMVRVVYRHFRGQNSPGKLVG